MAPFALVLFIFFNFFKKQTFTRPHPDYIKNMRMVQMIMGQTSDLVKALYDFIDDFLYWKDPQKSVTLIKEALKLPLPLMIALFWLPLRYFLVLGMWAGAAQSSPFFTSVINITVLKGQEAYVEFDAKYLQHWLQELRAHIMSLRVPLYTTRFFVTVWQYCKVKMSKYKRLRPQGYERQ